MRIGWTGGEGEVSGWSDEGDREYDPALAALCEEVFGDTKLVYTKPATRLVGHLEGYEPGKVPKFAWPERLRHPELPGKDMIPPGGDAGGTGCRKEALYTNG